MARLLSMILLVGLLSLAGLFADDKTDQDKKEPPKKNLMTLKLEHAQKLLAAVAQNDSVKVEENAQDLINISKELAWRHIRTERYDELSKEYRFELETLIKADKFKNNDAMQLGYVKTSLACFKCHNHVREVRIADSHSNLQP